MDNQAIEKPKMPANLIKELSSKTGTIYTKETMKYIEDYAKYLQSKAQLTPCSQNLSKSTTSGSIFLKALATP